ncbi:cation diffusion facilitator family transporter [Niveibacterium terrae]|uniref:cation diffusion facilitator family transporter n=1 Tax=Niveibacterium terrae TaxID=3373598 RepID=UPI003A94308B
MTWTLSPAQKLAVLSIATSIATLSLKFGAYFLTNSVSLYSDAVESFVNLVAASVALIVLIVAERLADRSHPWGHDKAMYFSSGLEGALILVAAFSIGWAALQRMFSPELPGQIGLGIAISLLASLLNAIVATVLLRYARRHDGIVLEADAHHLLTDVWTSVGVVIALGVLIFRPEWKILEPVVALLVAANIVKTGISILRRSADGLMDAALPAEDLAAIESAITPPCPSSPATRHCEPENREPFDMSSSSV